MLQNLPYFWNKRTNPNLGLPTLTNPNLAENKKKRKTTWVFFQKICRTSKHFCGAFSQGANPEIVRCDLIYTYIVVLEAQYNLMLSIGRFLKKYTEFSIPYYDGDIIDGLLKHG